MHKALPLAVLLVSACGGINEHLDISTLSLSPSTIAVSTQTTVNATFETDGLYDQVHYRILSPDRSTLSEDSFDKESPNFLEPNGLMLPMTIPNAARYTFELWASEGGAESNHLEAFLTAQ